MRELAVGKAEVAFEDCRKRGAVVCCHREVAPLIELRLGEAGPIAIDAAAANSTAQHPDDIAVTVIAVMSRAGSKPPGPNKRLS